MFSTDFYGKLYFFAHDTLGCVVTLLVSKVALEIDLSVCSSINKNLFS